MLGHDPTQATPVDDLPTPTPRELELLKVLWEHGPKSVSEVHRLLKADVGWQPAPNTVQTLLRIMATKGLVTHTAAGRTFIYAPVFSREETASRFLDRVFDGAASQLVQSLLKAEKITPGELEQMRQLINQARKKS
ncbi:MAG TPA: BlaI/MecI/CopY family transcriptional regulator [Fimbriiglobus sp.]|nr:BlaI/MecI/CopY family transcriptional regulator [Fimbriiglobus sp.]